MRFRNRLHDSEYDATLDDPEDEMFDAAWAAARRRPFWNWLTGPWRSLDTYERRVVWSSPSESIMTEPVPYTNWQVCERDISPWWVRLLRWAVPDARVSETGAITRTPPRDTSGPTS